MGALAKRSESAADLRYADGEWSAVFLVERKPAEGPELRAGEFLPIAFSVWDGFGGETGEKRGVTSWYTLYLRPEAGVHPALPAGAKALGVLAAGALAAFLARRSKRRA
jgi:hypothetical protein